MKYADALALVREIYGIDTYDLSSVGEESDSHFFIPPADIEAEGAPGFIVNKNNSEVTKITVANWQFVDECVPSKTARKVSV